MTILVTGCAGFIGSHVVKTLLARGEVVLGLDNINDYYDVSLKRNRLVDISDSGSASETSFEFQEMDIQDNEGLAKLFAKHQVKKVVHLAAQAGVRYSIENPRAYIDTNIVGFLNILQSCQANEVDHLVYASSSSVYGNNKKIPYSVDDSVDNPISMYAATKKSNELMAHVFSHLYKMPTTGLRFFTVYGPWGRPDMSPFLFASAIFEDRPLKLFNYGKHKRDFTYIDDIVDGIVRVLDGPPTGDLPYAVHNIGNHNPVDLEDYVKVFEDVIGKKAIVEMLPMQAGDVETTFADISTMQDQYGYQPATSIEVGVRKFVDWYRSYYDLK
jgi:UDP-glucuronate 4-epimerase